MKVDWTNLGTELGTIKDGFELAGDKDAEKALVLILGVDFFEQAVEHYIKFQPGFELARAVLCRLKPWIAMQHCYHIYKNSEDIETKRNAIELLKVLADRAVLQWIPEFLKDSDENIQNWSIGMIDQLLFGKMVDYEDVRQILEASLNHPNEYVRDTADSLLNGYSSS